MIRACWVVAVLVALGDIAISAWGFGILPDRVPIHWNIHNEVDGYGSKWITLALMPIVVVGIIGLFAALPALSPKGFEIDGSRPTLALLMVIVLGLMSYVHTVILYATWYSVTGRPGIDLGRLLLAGMFPFFGLMGVFLRGVHKNFYVGVRVPWTLASDRVWTDTHRLTSWVWAGASVLGLVLLLLGVTILVPIAVLVVGLITPIVYSYMHYKRLERQGAL